MTTAPAPGTPEWAKVMTASKVAAVLGLSPWESPRSMWHKMRGEIPSDDGSNADAKARGHFLERGILDWWTDRHGLSEYSNRLIEQDHRSRDDWAAATPDLTGVDEHGNEFVLDAKTANDDRDWGEPGTDQVPAYYATQSMWQLYCHPEAQVAYIAVLFGSPRLSFEEYLLERDEALIAAIVDRCRQFYDSLSADEPPALDDSVATYDAIRKLHPDIDRDAVIEIPEELAQWFTSSKWAADNYEAEHREVKSRLLEAMGNARIAKCNGQVIARRQPNRNGVSLVAVAKLPESENAA